MKTASPAHWTAIESAFATASEIVAAIRAKQITARELLDMTFQRIDRHNPALNAIVWENREDAIARATRADDLFAKGAPAALCTACRSPSRRPSPIAAPQTRGDFHH